MSQYDPEKYKAYMARKADETEAKLNALLDAHDREGFFKEWKRHALNYLTRPRRKPIYMRYLKEHREWEETK